MVRTPPRGSTPFLTLYYITLCVSASIICAYGDTAFDNGARGDSAGQWGSGGKAGQGSPHGGHPSAAAGGAAANQRTLQSSSDDLLDEQALSTPGTLRALSPPGTAPNSPDPPSSHQSHQPASIPPGTHSQPTYPPHYSSPSPGQQHPPNYPPHYGPHYPPSYSPHYAPQPAPPSYFPTYTPSLSPPALPLPPPLAAPPSPSPATSQLPALNPTAGPAPAPSPSVSPDQPPSSPPPPYPPSPPGAPPGPPLGRPNFLVIMTGGRRAVACGHVWECTDGCDTWHAARGMRGRLLLQSPATHLLQLVCT